MIGQDFCPPRDPFPSAQAPVPFAWYWSASPHPDDSDVAGTVTVALHEDAQVGDQLLSILYYTSAFAVPPSGAEVLSIAAFNGDGNPAYGGNVYVYGKTCTQEDIDNGLTFEQQSVEGRIRLFIVGFRGGIMAEQISEVANAEQITLPGTGIGAEGLLIHAVGCNQATDLVGPDDPDYVLYTNPEDGRFGVAIVEAPGAATTDTGLFWDFVGAVPGYEGNNMGAVSIGVQSTA